MKHLSSVLIINAIIFLYAFMAFSNSNYTIHQKLSFTENKGQVIDDEQNLRPDILYTVDAGNGVKAYLTKRGVMYVWIQNLSPSLSEQVRDGISPKEGVENAERISELESAFATCRMDMELIGANENPKIISDERNESYANYYLAHCQQGITHVRNYNKITYKNIYSNIDLVFYFNTDNELEYDFVIMPGGKIEDIKFQYKGNIDISITENGSLHITNPLGSLTEKTPFTYLQNNRREVASQFQLRDGVVSFIVDKYNTDETIIIDPTLEWGTYFGGSTGDFFCEVVGDGSGNVYATGYTNSTSGISTSGAFQSTYKGSLDCILAKFNANGALQWSSYYGSDGAEYALSAAYSSAVYIVGKTSSDTGLAYGTAYQSSKDTNNYFDSFLSKWQTDGTLEWSTYYSPDDANGRCIGNGVCADASGNIYLSGYYELSDENSDAFIVKFNSSGSKLWYASYGGYEEDYGEAVCTDANSNVYLAGETYSGSDIASGGYQNSLSGECDAFIVKFNQNGTLQWATYFGGSDAEYGYNIKCDSYSNVYLTGITASSSNIANGGYQNIIGGEEDGYLVKFTSSGKLKWSTYFGGTENDYATLLSIDSQNNIYLGGTTFSSSGIANSGGYQTVFGGGSTDGFMAKFNNQGSFKWASYFGGLSYDSMYGLYANYSNLKTNIYVAGYTYSTNAIASSKGYQQTIAGSADAYLARFSETTSKISSSILVENETINESLSEEDLTISALFGLKEQEIKMYPNPTNGIVIIEADHNSIISFFDIQGNKVSEVINTNNKTQLDLSSCKKGMYLVKIQNGSEQHIQKIILE